MIIATNVLDKDTLRFRITNFETYNNNDIKHLRDKLVEFKQWILFIIRRSFLRKKMADERLEWQDFYEVMQTYRHAPMTKQHEVKNAFEDVKQWIRQNYA